MNSAFLNIYYSASEAVCAKAITDDERRTLLRAVRPFRKHDIPTYYWFGAGGWPPEPVANILEKMRLFFNARFGAHK